MRVQCSGSICSKTFDHVAPGPRTAAHPSQDYHSFFHQDLSHLLERVNFGEAERWPALEGQGGDLPPYFDLGFHNILLVISTTFFEGSLL